MPRAATKDAVDTLLTSVGRLALVPFIMLLSMQAPEAEVQARPTFDQRVYVVGEEPRDIATADVNGDGHLDLLTANYVALYFSLLLGTEGGDFGPETRVPTTEGGLGEYAHTKIVAADLNGDQFQDVVMRQSVGVSIFLGHGDGTFGEQLYHFTETHGSHGIAVLDLSGDDRPDIVIGGDPVFVLYGYGDGTFSPRVDLTARGGFNYILPGHFTDDQRLDFFDGANLWVGLGAGVFSPTPRAIGGSDAVAHDFNGDGRLDVANSSPTIYLATGSGSFAQPTSYDASLPFPRSIALADLNGDGRQDLVLSTYSSAEIAVLLSNGDGTFAPAVNYPAPMAGGWLASGDFNRDGRDDVAVASLYSYGDVIPDDKVDVPPLVSLTFVMTGNGEGGFVNQRPARISVGDEPREIASGDFNGDGRTDVATANRGSDDVSILLNDADGTLVELARSPVGDAPTALAVGRFNADSNEDIAVANRGSSDISLLFGNGDGTFGPALTLLVGSVPSRLVRGDFDSNGVDDLAVLSAVAGELRVLLAADGAFQLLESIVIGDDPQLLAAVDMDGQDGPDLAVALRSTDEVAILLGNGDGTFGPATRYPAGTSYLTGMVASDLDGDGHRDLALVGAGSASVVVLHGDGEGGLSAPTAFELGARASGIFAADLNGDDRPDLVSTHTTAALVSVLLGDEAGFSAHREYAADISVGIAGGEFNGDGMFDLVVGSYEVDRVVLLLNQTPEFVEFSTDKSTLSWPRLIGVDTFNVYRGNLVDLHDADGDGLPDAGYGNCRNALDPDTTDTTFVDEEVPPSGQGFFYLMARVRAGVETDLGSTSVGQARVPAVACP